MSYPSKYKKYKRLSPLFFTLALAIIAIIAIFFIGGFHEATAAPTHVDDHVHDHDRPHTHTTEQPDNTFATNISRVPNAPCNGGPVIDGITLDECFVQNFNVDGTPKSITVWYTKNAVTATRTVDGNPVILEHWINSDAEAQQVAQWGQEAWERFYDVFGRHPYDTGCNDNINIQMEEGVGWSGIAYWASSGNCNIGIDSPMVRNGGGQRTVYHEFQHYVQYAFNDGCYDNIRNNYNGGAADGNAEFVEGYADLASDAIDAGIDSWYYGNSVASYDPTDSLYNKSYFDVYNKYYMEQTGSNWVPVDPHHHLDAVRSHYEECDAQDSIYVLDTIIPSLTGGDLSEEELFFNFFAANWAKDWADPTTQPELIYTDDDGNSYGTIPLAQDVSMSSGTQSWINETTPDVWGGQYYQVKPQAGCDYLTVEVDGEAGAKLGINLMAADTVGSTSVSRSGWIGEDFSRTFAANGVHNRIVASVNSFKKTYDYDVSFTCVTPTLSLLEPRQNPNFTLVGEPASPIAYLTRLEVTSDGVPVRGLPESSFTFNAEGDAINVVAGSFQEVGEAYWAIVIPPVKPVGTTFVDMEACLDGVTCDTETDSLLYVAPGLSDLAMVFDGSGSMTIEDVPGEGTRLENAQKAGTVMADLLQHGDRVLVMDFSAEDTPVGCGLPGGDGNCPLDINTYLNRTEVTTGTIPIVKNAIDLVNAREWTPIGGALVEAKNKLQAAPYSENPKHIVLLSDGEENVNPLYADVRDELIDSGVIINTVGFSSEAPEALLAQIAADTGGTYRFVPTTAGARPETRLSQQADTLITQGVNPNLVTALTANSYLPGPLALDNVYDYLETEAQGASRIGHFVDENPPFYEWRQTTTYVDDSATSLRLVIGTREADQSISCGATFREAQVLPPGGSPRTGWVVVNTGMVTGAPVPSNWDIRNSDYDDVVIVSAPDPGTWTVRVRYSTYICKGEAPRPTATGYPFLVNSSIQSEYRLQGRFLAPIMNNTGKAGDNVPIVATLMERNGTISGATVLGLIEKPNGNNIILFYDDGHHNDGGADDGIYGADFPITDVGGTYNVRLLAGFDDPAGSGEQLLREWLGAFWIDGPETGKWDNLDQDRDGLPDPWEERCNLDTNSDSLTDDDDLDGLTNGEEFARGTLPCEADTDHGGEQDGSEVDNGRNPLMPDDDFVKPFGHITIRPLDSSILIQWTRPLSFTNVFALGSTVPGELGYPVSIGNSGEYTISGLDNGQTYYITLVGQNGSALGDYAEPIAVTPKVDPVPPSGAILINNGAPETTSKEVMLNLTAVDDMLEGPAKYATEQQRADVPVLNRTTASGIAEMRISNNPDFAGASWESYDSEKMWTLGESDSEVHVVYAQFRDEAGNESAIVADDILLNNLSLYLPVVIR